MQKLIFATNSSKHLGIDDGDVKIVKFIDGEISVSLSENIQGKNVFVIGSTQPPSDNLVELLLLIDAIASRSPKKITAIIPYFGYARSDREAKLNEVACGLTVLKILETVGGKNFEMVAMDLHSQHLKTLFNVPVENISAIPLLASKFSNFNDLTVIAPDNGAAKRALKFASQVQNDNVFVLTKNRLSDSKVKIAPLSGKMSKNAVIVDDMVASGNTILEASKILKSNGVNNIYVAVTHMVYSAGGWKKLAKSRLIDKVYITNSIQPPVQLPKKFRLIDISSFLEQKIDLC